MSPGRARTHIFLPLVGQHDNIGDVILRRELLNWVEDLGEVHAYVGGSTDSYDHALGLDSENHVVYRGVGRWGRQIMKDCLTRRDTVYLFKPGEIQLTAVGLKEHVGLLPLVTGVRATGGRVLRVGAGARTSDSPWALAMQPSIALSHASYWRETETQRALGAGQVIPDLGFGQGTTDHTVLADTRDRTHLVVSLRVDRPEPDAGWRAGVRAVASALGADIVCVTQVARDDARNRQLAQALGAEFVGWDGDGHGPQEARLREVYQRSIATISDRLHVLIAALTEGSVPIAGAGDTHAKIHRHFDAAGFADISLPADHGSPADFAASALAVVARRDTVLADLAKARGELGSCRDHVRDLVRGRSS